MAKQDEPLAGRGKASGGTGTRSKDDSQAGKPTEAPEKNPSGSGGFGVDDEPLTEIEKGPVPNDPIEGPPFETGTDDPDSTSDTVLTPGSPSEYDRQRDARPNRDGDNWATDTTSP